ncbi:hypothetical protein [Acidovorax sp.]|uniref:hypothetical protein n=1 Tax=Acidovorax sp. TaxID=1872122 RepID=UPI00391A1A1B
MSSSINFPEEFLAILQQEGVSLQSEGVNDIALPLNTALRAIAILRTSRVATIGGEVWERVGDRFKPTYDGWTNEREDRIGESEYIDSSLNAAEKVVAFYSSRGGDFYIAFGI